MFLAQVSVRVIGFKQGHNLSTPHVSEPELAEIQKLIRRETSKSVHVKLFFFFFNMAEMVRFSPSRQEESVSGMRLCFHT